MNKDEILKLLNTTQTCFLATIEGSKPRVRGMMLYRADENGIIFHTGNTKDIPKQLAANPAVEICCVSKENTQVRVEGTAEILNDMELKKEIVSKRPFLKPWVEKSGYELLVIFRVKKCKATVWTFETNLQPKTYVNLN